jgi:hypothetical protein
VEQSDHSGRAMHCHGSYPSGYAYIGGVERRCAHGAPFLRIPREMDIFNSGSAWATELPAELVLMVVERLGADATIQDWMLIEQDWEEKEVPFAPLLEAWLRSLSADSTMWKSHWDEAEVAFVRRHLDSKCARGVVVSVC